MKNNRDKDKYNISEDVNKWNKSKDKYRGLSNKDITWKTKKYKNKTFMNFTSRKYIIKNNDLM